MGENSVRKHCKVICQGVSRKNREVLTSFVLSRSRRDLGKKGEKRKRARRPDHYRATPPPMAVGRMDEWMGGYAA